MEIIRLFPRSNRIEDTLNELGSIMINFRVNKHNFKINVTNELGLSDAVFSQIISRFKIYRSNRNTKFPEDNLNELYAIFFSNV
jgi:hypothetical protein